MGQRSLTCEIGLQGPECLQIHLQCRDTGATRSMGLTFGTQKPAVENVSSVPSYVNDKFITAVFALECVTGAGPWHRCGRRDNDVGEQDDQNRCLAGFKKVMVGLGAKVEQRGPAPWHASFCRPCGA